VAGVPAGLAMVGCAMESIASAIRPLLELGLGNLAAYLAAHVLLCLLPAFFIAAAAGSLLAVCSCTIVPLFAGIANRRHQLTTFGAEQ